MSHTPHELAEDFPEYADKISALKQSDAHFAKLAQDYHDVNGVLHRAETNIEPMDDLAIVDLRKKRMALKDEIYKMLTNEAA
ncbi:YdcH family protein [Parasulfitobacter algicola]|uniref:YdcH family protein n=1 Tax=Parasulfitobacter algicola TaxID=2614809 RepID=A0ABX2IW62_9RHOB|nr:YdcH family protein [Sulfitobacter algicola]NSX56540.1 YdcH family protein [Sulfitobacter algicola]